MRILVADDDREIVELLNIYLHNEGYDVIKAYNGHQALSYIKNDVDHEIGLIILDIMMPKIDGMQVLDKLRAASNNYVINYYLWGIYNYKRLGKNFRRINFESDNFSGGLRY